jgi:hypothetical protein
LQTSTTSTCNISVFGKMQASLGSRRAAAKDAGLTRAAKPTLVPSRSTVQATISTPDARCFQVTLELFIKGLFGEDL